MPNASILVSSADDCRRLAKLYRHLCAQTVAHQLELVVCGPPGFTQTAWLEPGPLASIVFTEVKRWPATLGEMREACLRLASAEIVIFGEDHSHPAPDWAEHLIAAHESGWHGVGASVANGNPTTAVSWADQLASYGRFSANGMSGVSEDLPWQGSSYRRSDLLACGDRLVQLLSADVLLQRFLRDRGLELYLESRAVTFHIHTSLFRSHLSCLYHANQLYGYSRAIEWGSTRRAMLALALPAIYFIRCRDAQRTLSRGYPRMPLAAYALLPLSLAAAAIGEVVGGLRPRGSGPTRMDDFELYRERHITVEDRQQWLG
jgi:hypothetical protein